MTNIVAVAKIGQGVGGADPNDYIFHSEYNTFKIIKEGTASITLAASTNNQSFNVAHELNFIPLVAGFAKRSGVSQVFAPNGIDVETWGIKAGMAGDITFNYIASDATNMIFNLSNAKGTTVDVSIRYFCLEKVN